MPAPHAFYNKMLATWTASRNVFGLFYFLRYARQWRKHVFYCDVFALVPRTVLRKLCKSTWAYVDCRCNHLITYDHHSFHWLCVITLNMTKWFIISLRHLQNRCPKRVSQISRKSAHPLREVEPPSANSIGGWTTVFSL